MKKLLCLLLALVMVLSLAACGGSDDKEDPKDKDKKETVSGKDQNEQDEDATTEPTQPEDTMAQELEGTWVLYVFMSQENTGLEGFETDAGLPIAFTFNADGTYVQVPYAPEIDAAIAELQKDLCDYMVELMYTTLESEGYTRSEIDTLFESTYGMSLRAYAEENVAGMDMESFADERGEGSYTLEEDKLYLSGRDETLTIAIDGDTLTILDSDDADNWENLFGDFPIELKRVD